MNNTKISKTFRLSRQALERIEQRNLERYPNATDFLEAKILCPTDPAQELLSKILMELTEVKKFLEQQERMEEKTFLL